MPPNDPLIYVRHIRDGCERLMECAALRGQAFPERILLDAACRSLEILGEAANKVGPEFRAAHPELPWRQMVAARNVLIHGYEGTDPEIVWAIVEREVPALLAMARRLLGEQA